MLIRKRNRYLERAIELIYTKHRNLLPFLEIFRNDIETIQFVPLGENATAVIMLENKKFNILFNTDYIKRDNLSDEDILWTICHEISHYILGHLTSEYENKYPLFFRNFGYDCQVNSMLYNINKRKQINVLKGMNWESYSHYLKGEEEIPFFLLVPPPLKKKRVLKDFEKSQIEPEKRELLIEFWFKNYSEEGLGLEEIFEYLEKIMPLDNQNEEETEPENAITEEKLPQTVLDFFEQYPTPSISEDELEAIIEDFDAKLFYTLDDIELNNRKLSVLRQSISRALFSGTNNDYKKRDWRKTVSTLPNVSRKESLLIAEEYNPLFYTQNQMREEEKEVAIYVDFSYSTEPYHAEIAKILTALKNQYKGRYFAFTTKITEMTFNDLIKGEYNSGGTDIEPVYEHINQNGFEKTLIITDGEFSKPSISTNARIFALLLGEGSDANAFGVKPEKVWKII